MLEYLAAFLSSAFRIGIYLFLRVIPSGVLRKALPVVYILYLSTLYVATPLPPVPPKDIPNGDAKKKGDEVVVKSEETTADETAASTTLIFSLPTHIRSLNLANVAINTLLFLLALDFTLYPLVDSATGVIFTRVGAVYPDSVRVTVRYPLENATSNEVHLLWRENTGFGEPTWNAGPSVNLTAEDDWTGTVRLGGLWPSTHYEYVIADAEGTVLPYPAEPIKFHTFPDPRLPSGSKFRFIVSSCVTPNFPYLPFHGRRIKGFDLLADYIWPSRSAVEEPVKDSNDTEASVTPTETPAPTEFILFLGDFVYADVPLYFGDNEEAYRRLYRRNYQSESFRKIYERLPMLHTYDDHEIINNYIGASNDSKPPFTNADNAFSLYNADANYDSSEPGQHYYDFRYADVAFFVMDTRRHRSELDTEIPARTMLGDKQLSALYDWLGRVNNTATFKFIVSSVPFTSLWQHDAPKDSWGGYEYEKSAILSALHSVPNVVVLSGDRHEFAAIKFNAEGHGHSVLEFSTSPLSMFYIPFVRTLRNASENTVKTIREYVQTVDGVETTEVVEEEHPQEEVIKYVAEGNYKWSAFEIDTRDLAHPKAYLELMVDGRSAFKLEITGKPVELRSPSALGAFVPSGIRGVLDKIGLKPSRWF